MYLSSSDDSHRKMWEWYKTRPGKGAQIYNLGWALRLNRNHADYDETKKFVDSDAELVIKKAESLAKLIAEHEAIPPRRS